jgi:type VI protein secretion system component Hcp
MPIDAFLEIIDEENPVHGESDDEVFKAKKAIEVLSVSLEPVKATSVETPPEGEATRTKGVRSPLAAPRSFKLDITKEVDNASPNLFLAYCRFLTNADPAYCKPFDSMRLTLRKAAGPNALNYLVLEFSDVFVVSYKMKIGGSETVATEDVSFGFESCMMTYRIQTTTGRGHSPNIKTWNFANPPK